MVGSATDYPFVGSDFTDEEFAAIGSILAAAGGVAIEHYNSACIKRRMALRIRDLGLPGALSYIEVLSADPAEAQRLSALLSLHVSIFYRDPMTFAALRTFLADDVPDAPQRWWSAGCAGGEEPYTLALLAAKLPQCNNKVEILATDVSSDVIEKARAGIFDDTHLSRVPAAERALAFTAAGGSYRIKDDFRRMVHFQQHDLLSDLPYPPAGLILCRYVLMYLTAADQEEIVRRFAAALPAGGILVIGRTETLRDSAGLFAPVNAGERIYQRR